MVDVMSPAAANAFIDAVTRLQNGIDLTALEQALVSGNLSVIESAAGSGRIQAIILADDNLMRHFRNAATLTGTEAANLVSEVSGIAVAFNATDPAATIFARTQTAELVVKVGNDVKDVIRTVTALGAEVGLTVQQQAIAIKEVIGLPPNWARAPVNFANELRRGVVNPSRLHNSPFVRLPRQRRAMQRRVVEELKAGVAAGKHLDPAWVAKQQTRYTENLLKRRARNIARTETARAAVHGQQMAWEQAINEGALPDDARRHWIVTPDDRLRETHAAIPGMNPDGVGIKEPFKTPLGDFMNPPIEPNCRCATGLTFPGLPGVL